MRVLNQSPADDPQRTVSLLDNIHLRLFDAQTLFIDEGWDTPNVQSSFWRFYFNESDGAALELPSGLYPLEGREIYFVPAGVHFSCCNTRHLRHFYVHFDLLGLPAIALRELFSRPVHVPASGGLQRSVQSLMHDLHADMHQEAPDVVWQCRIKSLIYEALWLHLSQISPLARERLGQLSEAHAPVMPAIQHIESNLPRTMTNGELARLCYLSEDYFIRRFRECVGQSPSQYIRERRVTLAAQQLLFSNASIDDIATSTGFGNRFYFSRVFMQHFGISPAAYRKTSRV